MGVLRVAVTAVLILATAVSAAGQCVSDARTISTRQSVPNLVAGPAAWGNGVLAVAKSDAPTRRIFLGTYDHDFNAVSGDRLIASDTADGPLALLWNGTDFGLFYRTSGPRHLVLQRIALTGEPIGTPIPVSSRTINVEEEVDATWSNALNAYVVAATHLVRGQVHVWVTVIGRDGIVQRDVNTFIFAPRDEVSLNVAVTDDGVIGAFYRTVSDGSIGFVRIPRGADVAIGETIWSTGHDLNVAALGNRFYLVKTVIVAGRREIRWLVVDSDTSIVGADRPLLSFADLDLQPLALITNGEELALSYLERGANMDVTPAFRLHRFTPAGTPIADSLFAAANPPQRFAKGEHDFVWTGSAYVATAVHEATRTLDSLLIRLCPLRAFLSTPRQYVTNDEFVTFTGTAEGGAPAYSYRWNPGNTSATFAGETLRYRFIHNGLFTVTLTVTDASGVSTSTTTLIHVVERKKRAVRK